METTPATLKPLGTLGVFFSYSHKDSDLRDQLETHLAMMKRRGVIETWHDRRIVAGEKWADQIDEHLNSAQIILLLISPYFIASDYCYGKEMARAQERKENGEAELISVILRPGDYADAPFMKYQCRPPDLKPVTRWSDLDEAFANVAKGIREAVDMRLAEIKKKQQVFMTKLVRMMQLQNNDNLKALAISIQMQSDNQKSQTERWKILQDTQTKILSIQQDVAANKAATQDKAYKKWDKYIRGEDSADDK